MLLNECLKNEEIENCKRNVMKKKHLQNSTSLDVYLPWIRKGNK